jgi:hypothetical protein
MLIKMLTVAAGADGVFPIGARRTVNDIEGAELVAGGYAVRLDVAAGVVADAAARKGKTKDKRKTAAAATTDAGTGTGDADTPDAGTGTGTGDADTPDAGTGTGTGDADTPDDTK